MSDVFLKTKRGLSSALKTTAVNNGTFLVTTDTQKLYFDIDDVRLALGDVVLDYTEAAIKALETDKILPKLYLSSDTNKLYYFDSTNTKWVVVGGDSVAKAEEATKASQDGNGAVIADTYETKTDATSKQTALQTSIDELKTQIGNLNSFEVKVIDKIADAPTGDDAKSNVIYFVKDSTTTDSNKYDEYIWIVDSTDSEGKVTGHYENIGTTEAELSNYYTKTEIDSKITALETADSTNSTAITNLTSTVSTNKTAADKTQTDLETLQGTVNTLSSDLSTLQGTVNTNKTAADKTQTDLETLQTTVSTNKTAQETGDKTLQDNIDTLSNKVDGINNFKKEVVDALPTVDAADAYTLYFVPTNDDKTLCDEYMLIEVKGTDGTTTKRFEKINSDTALSNYYTKSEIDSKVSSLESSISTNGTAISTNTTNISNLTTTVNDNKTAQDTTNSGFDTRISAVEDQINKDSTGEGSDKKTTLAGRVTALESTVSANETDIEKKVSDLSDTVSSNKSTLEAADSDLGKRISTLETDIGTYPTGTDAKTVAERLTALETDVSTNETDIEKKVSDLTTTVDNNKSATDTSISDLKAADTTLGDRITPLEQQVNGYKEKDSTSGEEKEVTTTLNYRVKALEDQVGTSSTDGTLQTQINTLKSTVESNKTASDNADSALSGRVDTLETDDAALKKAVGSYPTTEGTKDITTRLSDIETAASTLSNTVATNKTATDKTQTDLETLQSTVATNKTAQETADTDLQNQITDLKSSVGNINKFNIKVLEAGESLPDTGEAYTLYFVPVGDDGDTNDGKTKYTEYMWITETSTDSSTGEKTESSYFEEIGITEADLGEYYTSSKVDELLATINTTIATNKTAQETGDTTLGNRITPLEQQVNGYSETVDGESKEVTTTLNYRVKALESSESTLEKTVSDNKTASDNADSALSGRLDTVEKAIGTYPTTADTKDITTRLTTLESNVTTDTGSLNTRLSTLETTVSDNKTTQDTKNSSLDKDIKAINDELDTHSFKYAGSTEEGGAATKVAETASTADESREVLVASKDHTSVEYSSKVTANPSTGDVTTSGKITGASLVVDSIILGGATLTYDKTNDKLVVNFNETT